MQPSTQYHLELDAESYADVFGNGSAGIHDESTWSFTTQEPEEDVPTISDTYPTHGSKDVALERALFMMNFDELVTPASGEYRLVKTSTGETIKTHSISINNSFDNQQSIGFSYHVLEPSTQYHIEMDAGSYVDVFGNEFAGILEESEWSFTTRDPEADAPTIVETFPAHGSNDVSIFEFAFSISFSEIVTPVSGEYRLVITSTGETVSTASAGSINFFADKQIFYFSTTLLEPDTQYHVEIDQGSYVDAFGNTFAGILEPDEWTFRTESDEEAPMVIETYPKHESTYVDIDKTYFWLDFNEWVTAVQGGEWRLIKTSTGETVESSLVRTFSHYSSSQGHNFSSDLLEPSTQYHIEIDAGSYVDGHGNEFTGILGENKWSFTTYGTEKPLALDVDKSEIKIKSLGSGRVRVAFAEPKFRDLTIYSLGGKVVQRKEMQNREQDLDYLKPGLWVLRWQDDSGITRNRKFFVE